MVAAVSAGARLVMTGTAGVPVKMENGVPQLLALVVLDSTPMSLPLVSCQTASQRPFAKAAAGLLPGSTDNTPDVGVVSHVMPLVADVPPTPTLNWSSGPSAHMSSQLSAPSCARAGPNCDALVVSCTV